MRIRFKCLAFLLGFLIFLPTFFVFLIDILSVNGKEDFAEAYEKLKPGILNRLERTSRSPEIAPTLKSKADGVISQSVLLGYSNADKLSIFSSFTGEHGITVILSSYGYLNRRVYCRLFDKNKREVYQKAVTVFPEFTVKCSDIYPVKAKFVSVTVNKHDSPANMNRIVVQTQRKQSEFTVCLAPLFGESPKALILMEFVEYYKLQGADAFLVYSFNTSLETERLLNYYKRSSDNLKVIRIGNQTKCLNRHRCRHEMQLQDCVFRTQKSSKWVATVDLDERIMPINEESTLLEYIRKFDNPKISELRFRCQWTLRYSEVPRRPPAIDNLPMMVWHNTSHVAPQNHTTKSIIRPQNVESMGVHGVQKFQNSKFIVKLVEPEVAVVRHYRFIQGWSFFLKEAESFGDFSFYALSSHLSNRIVKNVAKVIAELSL